VAARNRTTRLVTIAGVACAALAFVAGPRSAFAQGEIAGEPPPTPNAAVDPGLPPGLPFSTGELAQALLARLSPADEPGPPRLKVEPAGADAVSIQVGDRRRVVQIGERNGPAAARVVALVIAELLSDDRDTAQDEAGAAAGPAVTVSRSQNEAAPPVLTSSPSPASGPSPPARLCVTGGATKGLGTEELLAGTIDADVVLPYGPSWARVAPSAGLVLMPKRNDGTFDEVEFRSAVGRLLAGGGFGPLELLGGPFVAAYSITGATEHAGVLLGGEALARFTLPLSRRLSLVAAARVDVYANRVRVQWVDGGGYATPRVGAAIGIGLAWDWPS
jgi:hypothetical protein